MNEREALSEPALQAAVKKAVEVGLVPKYMAGEDSYIAAWRNIEAVVLAALASAPAATQGEAVSPMAKMAQALRGKALAERAAFDTRVQSGEWGPMPDAGTEADCPNAHVATIEGDDAVRQMRWNPNVAAFDYEVGTKLYAAPTPQPTAPATEPMITIAQIAAFTGWKASAIYRRLGNRADQWALNERAGKGLNELEWAARYASSLTMSERLVAASVMSAFTELIRLPQRQRNKIIAELRKGPATAAQLGALAAEIQPPQKAD